MPEERRYIREVWASNLSKEMEYIRSIIKDYNYIAMDTEFPGTVAKPLGKFKSPSDLTYQTVRANVDLLKMIQLGISFSNEKGEQPPDATTWQFNFKFSLDMDMYSQDSIDLLINSGLDFKKHEDYGIDPHDFGEILMSSGLVLLENVTWITFSSAYDFAYLLKILSGKLLPPDEEGFYNVLKLYFPNFYDIKYLMKCCKTLGGGLKEIAETLQIARVGQAHQAGSDSLVTLMAFFKMRNTFFEGIIDDNKFL
ncbi:A Tob-Hcaf1 complex [Neoconidiobolus thromboides FSU 785]|nr:A Tob-Hcaf1 complex [Neoconidiobolus thromboides FSU 785]